VTRVASLGFEPFVSSEAISLGQIGITASVSVSFELEPQ